MGIATVFIGGIIGIVIGAFLLIAILALIGKK